MNILLLPKTLLRLFLIISLSFSQIACDNQIDDFFDDIGDDDDIVCDDDTTTVTFKQIAYWAENDEETLDDIDFSLLTHIIYNKIGVDSDGELILPSDTDEFEEMIELAQASGVYAMASIGNSSDSAFNSIAANDDALDNFIDNVQDLIKDYDLEGIDINWQFPSDDDEGDLFEDLIKEVDDLADDEGVLFSYVVDSGEDDDATDDGVQDDVLDYGDFLNVMALETTDSDDLHSSLDDAQDAISYWTGRCVVQNRIVLAIPLYSQGGGELDYREIIEDDTDNACEDELTRVDDEDGNEYEDVNYNGIPTVNDKTSYALSNAGGVVLTSLEQDYFEDNAYSILYSVDLAANGSSNDICE